LDVADQAFEPGFLPGVPMTPFDPWFLVTVFAILISVPYLVGPVLIRVWLRQSAKPQLDPFDVDDPGLPKLVAQYFAETTEALRPLGFEVRGGVSMPNQVPRVRALLVLLTNRAAREAALVTTMFAIQKDGPGLATAYVEVITRFRDGTLVQTNDSEVLGSFPPRPATTTTQFPNLDDPAQLVRLHRALVERHGSDSPRVLRVDEEFGGDPVTYLKASLAEELEGQLTTGYLHHPDGSEFFRPTWKGAFLMTWGQLWPIKGIRAARRARKARQLLAELEPQDDLA
jgi:hypothetical protein